MTAKQIYTLSEKAADAIKNGDTENALEILNALKAAAIREEAKKWQ